MSAQHPPVRPWCLSRLPALSLLALLPLGAGAAIDEIIVTAQKRAQDVLDVPIAVSAFSEQSIRDAGIRDIKELAVLSPSLVVTSTQSESAGTTVRVRGVGTTGDNLGLESSVAVFVDGVYRNRNSVALSELGEVERIEVLRGPQGTLFGKNASAGLLHIITRKPDLDRMTGYAELSGGEYSYVRTAGGISTPFTLGGEKFAAGLDVNWVNRDGFIDDIASGTKYNDRDRWNVRGQLVGSIGEDLDLRIIVDAADSDETCCAAVTTVAGPTAAVINALGGRMVIPPDPFARKMTSNANRGYEQKTEESGISAELNWRSGIGQLTSITAYRYWESRRSQDIDFTAADILYRDHGGYSNEFDTFTQELRLAGTAGPVDWLVGLFYVDEKLKVDDAIRVGSRYEPYFNTLIGAQTGGLLSLAAMTGMAPGTIFPAGSGVIGDRFRQDAESWALFTHNIWHINDRFDLTLGLRYTDEQKDLDASLAANNPACPAALSRVGIWGATLTPQQRAALLAPVCLPLINPLFDGNYSNGKHDDQEWTGIASLSYHITDSWLSWASYSRGYKAGGFNLDRGGFSTPPAGPSLANLDFREEVVNSWELGAKGYLLDDSLQLAATYFYSTFDNFQLNTFTGTNFIVSNLKEVESRGIELESTWKPIEQLVIQSGLTYTDARYDDKLVAPDTALSGKRITNAPYWIMTAAATWEEPVTDTWNGFVHLNYRFMSDYNTGSDLDPLKRQSAFAVWNGRIGLRSADKHWEINLWAQNLFDRDYRQVVIGSPLQTGSYSAFLGDPRMIGVSLRVNL